MTEEHPATISPTIANRSARTRPRPGKRTTAGQFTTELFGVPLDFEELKHQFDIAVQRAREGGEEWRSDPLYRHVACLDRPCRTMISDRADMPAGVKVPTRFRKFRFHRRPQEIR